MTLRVSTNLKSFVLFSTVPNSLLIVNLVFCNWIRGPQLLFYDISDECVKLLRALRFWFISVLWAGTGCRFFVLGAGIGQYGGVGLSPKYCSNCRTFLLGVGIGILLLGAGIGRASPPPPPPPSGSGDRAICFLPYINQILEFTHCDSR